jgi:hypothetical protein
MKRVRSITRAASRLLVACAAIAALGAGATGLVALAPSACDHEWERMKSLLPMSRVTFEAWLKRSPAQGVLGSPSESEADYYYFLARVPFVIEDPALPTMQQREEWLQKAADKGHKAAKASLMRLRYMGVVRPEQRPQWPRYAEPEKRTATRQDYLKAAREAAEAGDPEFAAVMMDTAQNINRPLHCHADDTQKLDPTSDPMFYRKCDPQEVTRPIETKKWAEIAARGGNPNAKEMLCRGMQVWPHLTLGFTGSPEERFAWCFAAEHAACLSGAHHIRLDMFYERGIGTTKDLEKAKRFRELHPVPVNAHKRTTFPLVTD